MASVLESIAGAITEDVPDIGILQAQRCVNNGWKRIQLAKDNWSFNTRRTRLTTAAQVNAGSVTVTQDSATVALDATADAAVTSAVIGRRFRIGTGPHYIISAYSSPNLTLEETYNEDTASGASYAITDSLLLAPADLRGWITVLDQQEVREIATDKTRQELDASDIQRTAGDDPGWLVPHDVKIDTTTTPATMRSRWEWYPNPTARRVYETIYYVVPWDLAKTGTYSAFPPWLPDELLQWAAQCEAYEWAEANRKRTEALSGADWRYLLDKADRKYREQLDQAMHTDEDMFLANWGTNYLQPRQHFGAEFLQGRAPYGAA